MNLIEKYYLERENLFFIKKENAFLSYKIFKDTCLLNDIYVEPEFRNSLIGSELEQDLIKICVEKKVSQIHCQVDIRALNADLSMKVILSRKYIPYNAENNIIKFYKELN